MPETKVYLVGAGPGDAGLMTIKGLEALKKAGVVIYDFLANEKLLEHVPLGAECVYVGKKGRFRHISQDAINRLIVKHAKKGKVVVRLKGGDPFVFGRGGEEALALVKAGISFEVVPGVTSAISVPAYAGIPLTHRDLSSSVTFLTGQEKPGKGISSIRWDKLSSKGSTLVILMGWKNLEAITGKLIENGRDPKTPVAVIRWGTLPSQTCVTGRLDTIARVVRKKGVKPPVVTIIGEVVALRKELNWFETKPLFGKKILITRTTEQAGVFSRLIEELGGEPMSFPVIKLAPLKNTFALDSAIKGVSSYDWAIFTSVNGVKYFFERLYALGFDLRELKGVKICAIGPATGKALLDAGIKVDLTPKEYVAESVIKSLGKKNIRGKRFLLPRALKAREVIPTEIRRFGGRIDVVTTYETVRPVKEAGKVKRLLKEGKIDVATFTSSSTVENFASLFKKVELKRLLKGVKVACIGPVTAKTAKGLGLKVSIMPKKYTIPDFAKAIADYFVRR